MIDIRQFQCTSPKSHPRQAILFIASALLLASAASAQTPSPASNVQIDRHAGKINVRWDASPTANVVYHVTYKPHLDWDPRDDDEIGTDLTKHNVWQLGDIDAPCCTLEIEGVPFFWGVIAGVRAMKNQVGSSWVNSHHSPVQPAPPPTSVAISNRDSQYLDLTITPADSSGFGGFSIQYVIRLLRSDGYHPWGKTTREFIQGIPIDGVDGIGVSMDYLINDTSNYHLMHSDYVDDVWGNTTGTDRAQAPTNVTLVRGNGGADVTWEHPIYVGKTRLNFYVNYSLNAGYSWKRVGSLRANQRAVHIRVPNTGHLMAAVKSFDGDNDTPWVNSNVVGPLAPGAVASITVCRAAANDLATVNWTAPQSGTPSAGYNLVYQTTSSGWQRVLTESILEQISQPLDLTTESIMFGVQAVHATYGAGPWRNSHWVNSSTTVCP